MLVHPDESVRRVRRRLSNGEHERLHNHRQWKPARVEHNKDSHRQLYSRPAERNLYIDGVQQCGCGHNKRNSDRNRYLAFWFVLSLDGRDGLELRCKRLHA